MAINWSNIGTALSSVTTAMTNLGITGTTASNLLGAIGLASNPNMSTEIAICGQILMFSSNPAMLEKLEMTLATEQGIPQAAAALALTLANPGVDIPTRILQIEQIIKNGG
jgi:hypothetical protein